MISIIVPVYNVEKYILRCLQSIKNQTYKDFEVIMVDDGSQDGSAGICKKFCDEDERFSLIHQKNGGLSAARNSGIDQARGEALMFVDSDDYIHPRMCEILLQHMGENDADIAVCCFKKVEEGEKEPIHDISQDADTTVVFTGIESCYNIYGTLSVESVVAWNKIYKKELFTHIRYPEGKIHEDEFVTYKLLYMAHKVVYTTLELYFYVQRPGSIMQGVYDAKHLVMLEMAEETVSFYKDNAHGELMVLAMQRALGLSRMLYEKYGQADDKTNQKRVLAIYEKMITEYLPYMDWKTSRKREAIIYGKSPYLANLYCQIVSIRDRMLGKISRMFQ